MNKRTDARSRAHRARESDLSKVSSTGTERTTTRATAQASEGRRRSTSGFTMAELLTAVAILIVLLGVAFVSLIQHQISLKQMELDSTAKEIYVAAQNHIALAESQGLLKNTGLNKGTPAAGSGSSDDAVYYIVHAKGAPIADSSADALSLMLPFGSIDDTVRTGGSYVIRYQPSTATILDVFYTNEFSFSAGECEDLYKDYSGADKKAARQKYPNGSSTYIIGYYGGEDGGETMALKAPSLVVENKDSLSATVKIPADNIDTVAAYKTNHSGTDAQLKVRLIVEGKTSKAKMWREADADANADSYFFLLDDVTKSDTRFAQIANSSTSGWNRNGTFIPGEDLSIQAWAVCKNARSTVAKSTKYTTNSLFANGMTDASDSSNATYAVGIRSFRHLANLSNDVSGFVPSNLKSTYANVRAKQETNLDWTEFGGADNGTGAISKAASMLASSEKTRIIWADAGSSIEGSFLPVATDYTLAYDGQAHSIANVSIDQKGPAGLFTSINDGCSVKNLEIVDATVAAATEGSSIGNAGALAGEMATGATVSNVLVRNTIEGGSDSIVISGVTAGGLVGKMAGGTVDGCAASVFVSGTTAAGGLIGSVDAGTVENSYSGGHTSGGAYGDAANIVSTGVAGGLVGLLALGASVTNCYSTCSAQGTTVGGLVGSSAGTISSDCYSLGRVIAASDSSTVGAYVGSTTGGSIAGEYIEMVNGKDVPAIGSGASDAVTAADADTDSFKAFATGTSAAVPYDTELIAKYQPDMEAALAKAYAGKYPYKTIYDENSTTIPDGLTIHLRTHYGDWPVVETLAVNTPSS